MNKFFNEVFYKTHEKGIGKFGVTKDLAETHGENYEKLTKQRAREILHHEIWINNYKKINDPNIAKAATKIAIRKGIKKSNYILKLMASNISSKIIENIDESIKVINQKLDINGLVDLLEIYLSEERGRKWKK